MTGPYEQLVDVSGDMQQSGVSIASAEMPNLCAPELPIYSSKSDIIQAITEYPAVVIISPPGTGKSTQVPKIALEAGFDLVRQTQPRRRPAVNVGSRILHELGVVLGEEKAAELVSWQTGAGLEGPRDAKIQVMTEGILMRKEGFRPTKGDNEIWMLDEIHEQGKYQAILEVMAKEKSRNNPNFTAIYASATPDKHGLINFLTDEFGREPAVIELSAKSYNVEYRERKKSDMVKEIMRAARDIHENPDAYGASNTIQVFESGVREINDIIDELYARLPAEIRQKSTILPNYAALSRKQQEPVYQDVEGIKIVVQTNIGKTSNTIPRTRYVITNGLERQPGLDEEGAPSLSETAISQDDMAQQFGRAGRTSDGIAVHTKRDGKEFIPLSARDAHMKPEIQRTPLDEVMLYLAARGDDIRTYDFKDKLDPKVIDQASFRLKALGALDSREKITKNGELMFNFAASPTNQRCLVEALNYSENIRLYMSAMAAASECGGLKINKSDDESFVPDDDEHETSSDMLAQLDLFIEAQQKDFVEMGDAGISIDFYLRIEELYRKLASSCGVSEIPKLEVPTAAEREILRICILAGYINNVYLPQGKGKFRKIGQALYDREISDRSVVSGNTGSPIIGTPRTVQKYVKRTAVPHPIVENVTKVSLKEVGKLAVNATQWVHANLRLQGDSFLSVEHQLLGSQVINAREVKAQPSPLLRAAVIDRAKDAPGENLKYLYDIKHQIEVLAHKSKTPVSLLSEDKINKIIDAVTPDNVTNPSHVNENLRKYILEHNISLETFVPREQQESIRRNAPDKFEVVNGESEARMNLKLRYRQGKPLVYVRGDPERYAELPDELSLDDGRIIRLKYGDSEYTVQQFKNMLYKESASES